MSAFRLKMNLKSQEFEAEGESDFVLKAQGTFLELIGIKQPTTEKTPVKATPKPTERASKAVQPSDGPRGFDAILAAADKIRIGVKRTIRQAGKNRGQTYNRIMLAWYVEHGFGNMDRTHRDALRYLSSYIRELRTWHEHMKATVKDFFEPDITASILAARFRQTATGRKTLTAEPELRRA